MGKTSLYNTAISCCPFLGTIQDSKTCFGYPANENHCFCEASKPSDVKFYFQKQACLSSNFNNCPDFKRGVRLSIKQDIPLKENNKLNRWRSLLFFWE
jgi:hypothetical protein